MSVAEAIDLRFKELAVELMRGIGVAGVSAERLMESPFREQFHAMLVDARARFDPATENHASICRLIEECNQYAPAPQHMGTTNGRINAGGTGFQVPRIEEPEPKSVGKLLKEAGYGDQP